MIVAILNVYLVILFILVKTKIVPFNLFWKCSPLIVLLLLMFGLFIPMGWGAPQGAALVVRNSVQIVPNVAGEVTEVPVEPNKPLKAGDVLFKIDPVPYQAQVDSIGAQVKFEELRLSQMTQMQLSDAGRAFDVEQRQADVDKLKGQLLGAKWNLDQTVVRAPADGYVTNVGLMKGARVANLPLSPVMAFIDTSETVVGVEIPQIYARYVRPGQEVEVTFKLFPGQVFTGKVDAVLQATSTGQVAASGTAVTPKAGDVGAVRRPRQARRRQARRQPAGRHCRRRGDLHLAHQAGAHHPQGDPAADRDRELRQSVLVKIAAGPDPAQSASRLDPLPATVVIVAVVAPPPWAAADEYHPVMAMMMTTVMGPIAVPITALPVTGLTFPVARAAGPSAHARGAAHNCGAAHASRGRHACCTADATSATHSGTAATPAAAGHVRASAATMAAARHHRRRHRARWRP